MIHCPKLGWAPHTGRISQFFTLFPNPTPLFKGVIQGLLQKGSKGLHSYILGGPRLGKSSCSDEGSQEWGERAVLGEISRKAPMRESSALSVHTALVRSPEEKQTLKCNGRIRSWNEVLLPRSRWLAAVPPHTAAQSGHCIIPESDIHTDQGWVDIFCPNYK